MILAVASCTSFWAIPSPANEQSQMTFAGTVSPQCSFSMLNDTPTSGSRDVIALPGNHGSITMVCNTSSTLSVTIDKVTRRIEVDLPKAKINPVIVYASLTPR
jgi:hypothetical protein